MDNIINDRSLITTSNAANLLFISTVDLRTVHTSKHGLEKEEITQQVTWLVKTKWKEDNYYEPLWKAFE